ncbi:MAG: SRPBCC family protein [Archangiaceae bacterium]|nr:SRPBCC family protein [Archangiaceae bacterium]
MSTTDRIEKQVTLKAPVARVWKAISDHREFSKWFGFTLETPFVAGQPIKGTFDLEIDEAGIMEEQKKLGLVPSRVKLPRGTTVFGTVERIEPERYFSFRWVPYAIDAEADPEREPTTLVELTLEKVAGGTQLTVVESGFDRVPEHRRLRAFRMNEGGWAGQTENLKAYVERA